MYLRAKVTPFEKFVNKLKKCPNRHAVSELIKTETDDHIAQLFLFLLQKCSNSKLNKIVIDTDHPPTKHLWFCQKRYNWLLLQVYRFVDFTSILIDNINNKPLVISIMNGFCRINWYKTFGIGKTILDIAHSKCVHSEILDLINNKFPPEMVAEIEVKNRLQTRCKPPAPAPPIVNEVVNEVVNVATPATSTTLATSELFVQHVFMAEEEFEELPPTYESLYPTAPLLSDL